MPKEFKIDFIDIKFIRDITHELARQFLAEEEPIPSFDERLPSILESCLGVLHGGYYQDNIEAFANFIYRLIKNHPFANGNKRVALLTLLIVLYKNGVDMLRSTLKNKQLAIWMIAIAISKPKKSKIVIQLIDQFIRLAISKVNKK